MDNSNKWTKSFSPLCPLIRDYTVWPSLYRTISSKTRPATVKCLSCNNRYNQRHFKGKSTWKTRFGVPSSPLEFFNSKHPCYLFKLIYPRSSSYVTRNMDNISFFKTRNIFLINSFFLSTVIQWNKLDLDIKNSSCFNNFRKRILKLYQYIC